MRNRRKSDSCSGRLNDSITVCRMQKHSGDKKALNRKGTKGTKNFRIWDFGLRIDLSRGWKHPDPAYIGFESLIWYTIQRTGICHPEPQRRICFGVSRSFAAAQDDNHVGLDSLPDVFLKPINTGSIAFA